MERSSGNCQWFVRSKVSSLVQDWTWSRPCHLQPANGLSYIMININFTVSVDTCLLRLPAPRPHVLDYWSQRPACDMFCTRLAHWTTDNNAPVGPTQWLKVTGTPKITWLIIKWSLTVNKPVDKLEQLKLTTPLNSVAVTTIRLLNMTFSLSTKSVNSR